jgi:DNA mismatch repair protein MutS
MMAGFKDFMLEKYLKKIQDAGFTAVVYTQDENMKDTTRSLAGVFSPGTYFLTETTRLSNSISCIWVQLVENTILCKGTFVVVGVANIDIYTGKTSVFEFKETYANNPTTYDELEKFISIYNPYEVVLISNLPNKEEMDNIVSYSGISCGLIHKIHIQPFTKENDVKMERIRNCEKQPYQKEILSKMYQYQNFEVFIQPFQQNILATQAFCYLLDFVYQHNPHLVNNLSEPVFENCSNRLILSNHSLKQLNMINDGTTKKSKLSSVSELLNDCSTAMGKRKLLHSILNPTCDQVFLTREYEITEYILNDIEQFQNQLKTPLAQIKDLSKIERQMFLKKISPKSIFSLYESVRFVYDIFLFLKHDLTIMNYLKCFISNIHDVETSCLSIIKHIDNTIDVSLAKDIDQLQSFEVNFLHKGCYLELDKKTAILKQSEIALERIRHYLSALIEGKEKNANVKYSFVKINETEKNNYSLISTSRRCKLLLDALPNEETNVLFDISSSEPFVFQVCKSHFQFEKQSATNNVIVEPQIQQLCKTISTVKINLKDLITRAYNEFIDTFVEKQQENLEIACRFITLVDVVYTKASLAKRYNYCRPMIVSSKKSFVEAKQLRHCLIEQFQTNELYVTNDISLGDGYTDGILLYGTNAVGKTSLIKALGISVIMAQAGLFVPCSSFRFQPYKKIFTRIIGNDNIFKGLSTFEVEMSELRTILKTMDENSLILGDELCSGTETISAISIFVAGIQKMCKCESSFIFATHLHEIVDYDEITHLKNVHLKHMEVKYDRESDLLIYDRKLKDGPGNKLYGLEVCKSLNLPLDFLELANDIRLKYNPREKSILSLKQSSYNSNKLISICEKCGKNIGTEIHHLQHQTDADQNGYIQMEDNVFHKNKLANLMSLCDHCHKEIHKHNLKLKRKKTSKGVMIEPTNTLNL